MAFPLQGCEKQLEKIRIDIFGGGGKRGPDQYPRGGKGDPKKFPTTPPPKTMQAPMQAPPDSKREDPPPRRKKPRRKTPPRKAKARVKPTSPYAGQDQPPSDRPDSVKQPPSEPADELDRSPAPRPDRYSAAKDSGSRYLSPSGVKRRRLAERVVEQDAGSVDPGQASPGALAAKVDSGPGVAPLTEISEDILSLVADDVGDVGERRVQISRRKDFKNIVFDRRYAFIEDVNFREEFKTARLPDGAYWVRFAAIDLLDFQHPYTEPKKFRMRR